MAQQVARLQKALNNTRAAISLGPIITTKGFDTTDEEAAAAAAAAATDPESSEGGLDSVDANDAPDTLASAPIKSLYEVTKPGDAQAHEGSKLQFSGLVIEPDFISRGVVTFEQADQLAKSYLGRLDHFFYDFVLRQYANIREIRQTSTLLAVTLCTIASLHDPLGTEVYEKLSRELRNVASSLMFRHRLGMEDIKALCMGSYWLGDMTWILSALVSRKAIAMHYHTSHLNQPATDKDGFYKSQMWLLIYLANEQISLLRGAPPASVDREFVNWETHLASPYSGEVDKRLVSHIDLLMLLSRVRQVYGVDTMKAIPQHMVPQLRDFLSQLDQWNHTWTGKLARNKWLGNFPSEAVKLHGRFAKFFVCSLAFRGLSVNSSSSARPLHPSLSSSSLPSTITPSSAPTTLLPDLQDIATSAITTALSILQQLIESDELRACLVGVPHYFHTMFAFAAVFLLKIATRYRAHVAVDPTLVLGTSRQVLDVFSRCPCARQHLVHRIASGLKEMIERCEVLLAQDFQGGGGVVNDHDAGDSSNDKHCGAGGMAKHMQDYQHNHNYDHSHSNGQNHANGAILEPYNNNSQDFGSHSNELMQWFDLENFDFLSMSPPSWETSFGF
ncbi:hypothetical protein EMPG_10322 [Blastomyces silverae]|uniref:Transcription factor domain-containing protein n=1 Tax=Blastomyces silverae TaxID=2060906 RepID=A0A0H1B5A1_9EURO|nr:hypothetical protein EMPG_10322 [Blastomyces silverae]